MTKIKSRPVRWAEATAEARTALEELTALVDRVNGALQTLEDLRAEYEEWRDNLPEVAQGTATEELLNEVADLNFYDELEVDTSAVEAALDEAEGVTLPRGFGRD